MLHLGSTIDGKYQLVSLLGSGGNGSVYKALQNELSRTVAIKVLHASTQSDEEARTRFEREARVLSAIKHEHIVGIYSFGVLPDGYPYMVMEHLGGKTVAQVLQDDGRLDWRRVVKIAIQVCQALSVAHKSGIIHRDLKPQNIMLLDAPEADFVKVLDFGLSRVLPEPNREQQKLTQTGAIVGSLHYMSPELCAGQKAGIESDIYSLGCVLYECLAGVTPFDDINPIGILHKHQTQLPRPLLAHLPAGAIPAKLEHVVFKALQKNPVDRFDSMEEFQTALTLLEQGRENELGLESVRIGADDRQNKKNKFLLAGLIGCLVVTMATLVSLKMTIGNSASKKNSSMAKVGKEAAAAEARLTDIQNAKKLATQAQKYKTAGNTHQVDISIRRALGVLGHSIPASAKNKSCALEEMGILETLATAGSNVKSESDTITKQMRYVEKNNLDFLPDVDTRARLFLAEGRLYSHYGERTNTASRFEQAIVSIAPVNVALAQEWLKEARGLTENPLPSEKDANIYLDLAEEQVRCSQGRLDQARILDDKCSEEIATILKGDPGEQCDLLLDLYSKECQLRDLGRKTRTCKRIIEQAKLLTHESYDETIWARTTGSYRADDRFSDTIEVLQALLSTSPEPELNKLAQAALDETLKQRERALNRAGAPH